MSQVYTQFSDIDKITNTTPVSTITQNIIVNIMIANDVLLDLATRYEIELESDTNLFQKIMQIRSFMSKRTLVQQRVMKTTTDLGQSYGELESVTESDQ